MAEQNKLDIKKLLLPQTKLDLIIKIDMIREQIDVRSSIIYHLDYKKYIIVAQTNPPVLKSMVGREIEASFIQRDKQSQQRRRFGFGCKILKYLPDYKIRSGVTDRALVLSFPTDALKETSVRLHFRVEPKSEDNISVALPTVDGLVHLLDISLGGMLISYDGHFGFEYGQSIPIRLNINDQGLKTKGEVVRIFEREGSRLVFVGFNFVEMDNEAQNTIQEAISRIMREELRQRSGMTNSNVER